MNVSGYYHKDKYGDKYLAIFEEKMRAAVALNQGTGKPVPLSFALGVETSHGKVHSADDIRVYLRKAAEVHIDGVIFFTWDTLLPFLKELDETDDIRNFPRIDDTVAFRYAIDRSNAKLAQRVAGRARLLIVPPSKRVPK